MHDVDRSIPSRSSASRLNELSDTDRSLYLTPKGALFGNMLDVIPGLFKGLLEILPPLRKPKRPNLAALFGMVGGATALGIYLWSFVDFIVGVIITCACLMIVMQQPELGAVLGAFVWGISGLWGYLRVMDSNRRLLEPVLPTPSPSVKPASQSRPSATQPPSTSSTWFESTATTAAPSVLPPAVVPPPKAPDAGATTDIWKNRTPSQPTPADDTTPEWWKDSERSEP